MKPLRLIPLLCALLAGPCAAAKPAEGADRCVNEAAHYHAVHPGVLRAILKVESGLNPSAINRNDNGTKDVGIGQINSIHFKKLAAQGVGPEHLLDACAGTYVSAWFLNQKMRQHGNTWQGIATYHSATPEHNQRYAKKIYQQLLKDGWIAGSAQAAALKPIVPETRLADSAPTTAPSANSVSPPSESPRSSKKNTVKSKELTKRRSPMMIEISG